MTRLISTVADRVLERVAPKATASACVPPESWYTCSRDDEALWHCHYTCSGAISCNYVGTC